MEKNPRPPYEAWLVIDKDHWTGVQIDELTKWVDHHGNRGLAVSNPRFEFWLLLHFEMGNDVHTSRECTIRLQRYLDDFSKHIDPRAITLFGIEAAIQHAKLRDNPPCSDWPHDSGSTTVYRLVERMLCLLSDLLMKYVTACFKIVSEIFFNNMSKWKNYS